MDERDSSSASSAAVKGLDPVAWDGGIGGDRKERLREGGMELDTIITEAGCWADSLSSCSYLRLNFSFSIIALSRSCTLNDGCLARVDCE